MAKLTVPSSCCSIMKASSPLSGCPVKVPPPSVRHGIHDAARRIEAQQADPQAQDHHRARHRGWRRHRHMQTGFDLHLPSQYGVPGVGE